MNWAKQNGLDVNDPMTSAKYSVVDIQKNYPALDKYLRTTTDVDEATQKFERDFEGASQPAMGNRLAAARTVYGLKGGSKTEPTVDGKPAVTTIVDGKPSATPAPKVEKAADKTAQADRPPDDQVASISDDEAMAIAIRKNQELKEQQNRDSPAPPPGPDAPMPKRSLPLDQQTQPRPPSPRGQGGASAIPPGPTVAAQDTPHHQWQEGDQPPLPPVQGREIGPENAGPRQWQEGDQPPLPPVQDREVGPENAGPRQWQESDQPALPPVPGEGPIDPSIIARQRIKAQQEARMPARPPSTGPTPVPEEPAALPREQGPQQGPLATTNPETDKSPVVTTPGRTGPAEVNVPLASGAKDDRTTPDADKPAAGAIPTSATAPATPQSRQGNSPRFIGITRPNATPQNSAQGTQGQMQSTALDLSSLWGPNPPVSQRGQAAATPVAVAAPRRDDDNAPIPTPDLSGLTDEQVMGQAKGGAVRRYASGGAIPARPAMRYAGGGAAAYGSGAPTTYAQPAGLTYGTWNSPTSTTYVPSASQPIMGVNTRDLAVPNPNQSMLGYQPWSQVEAAKVNDPSLTPDQKTWYQQQIANAASQNGSYYYNPASMPTTPAPAAPAPAAPAPAAPTPVAPTLDTTVKPIADTTVTDPTTTTGTGAVGIPNAPTAKSYDPNKDAVTGAGFANTNNAGGTNYTVGTDDRLKTNDAGDTISGYAMGGGIPARPTMRYADAGGVVSFSAPGYQGSRTQGQQYYFSPDYVGPTSGGGWKGTPYSALAPNQQAWADTQKNYVDYTPANFVQQASQWSVMPTAVWPTAAPAAPTTVAQPAPTTTTDTAATPAADPNNQPGAGAPGLNNDLTPTSDPTPTTSVTPPAPIVDPSTDTVTNTPMNPVPQQAKTYDPTQDTSGKYASGSKNTGNQNYQRSIDPNSASSFGQYDYGQIQGFDDGGGVNPSSLGMPPGLAGGQQPTPPIYYSGATYSPAGAPVGRGMTQNSLPTQIGMAIPTLPMLQGGMVRRYADGGEVDEYSGRPNEDVSEGGRSASGFDDYSGEYAGTTPAPAPDAYATASSPQDVHPDLPAWTPQVTDGQGNPSRGLVGAIAGGLHYLASQLGLSGDGQQGAIASDPQTQANRRSFVQGDGVSGAPMPSHEEVSQIHQSLGLNDGLHEGLSNLAGMEAVRNFYLVHGDPTKADQMAASMLQYSVTLARDFGDQAVKRYYANDLNGAVHAMVKAKEAIADGTLMNAHVNEDGQSVNIEGTDLNGKRLWAKTVAPEAILGAALHTADGSLAWHMYEMQAAKYDPATATMIKERQGRREQAAADEQIGKMGPVSTPYTREGGGGDDQPIPIATPTPAPQPAQPQGGPPLAPGQTVAGAIPPVAGLQSTPPLAQTAIDASRAQPSPEAQAVLDSNRGRSPDTTSASNASPPVGADSGQAPPAIPPNAARAAIGPAQAPPTLGVGPTQTAAANLPSPDAQEVAALSPQAEQARYQQIEQTVHAQYRDPKTGGIVLDGQLYQPPPSMDQATYAKMEKTVKDAWNERWKTFQWASGEAGRRASSEIDAQRRDYGVSLNTQRQGAQMIQQQTLENQREKSRQDAAALVEQNREKNEITLKQLDAQLHQVNTDYTANSAGAAPRNDTEMNSLAGDGKTFDPVIQLATAFNRDIGDPSKVTREAAMGSLAKQGFDANTILGMTDAWKAAVQHSRNTSPEEIAPAIQAFVTGQPFVWNAEAKDANGRPMPQHGATRFDVSVVDNTGNNISFRIPQDKLANLRNWRLQYTRQAQDTLSKNVGPQGPGVLSQLPGVPGVRGQTTRLDYEQPGVGTRPDWTAPEQTPF